jgi:hypothetical protein
MPVSSIGRFTSDFHAVRLYAFLITSLRATGSARLTHRYNILSFIVIVS